MLQFVLASLVVASYVLESPQDKSKVTQPAESQPASQPAGRTVSPRNPTQARILEALLRDAEQARPRPILSAPEAGRDGTQAGSDNGVSLLPDGYGLNERPGRLVCGEGRVEFHFASGSPAGDAPAVMEFNKNRWLEAMEAEAEAGVKEFIISAEVTRYRGRNYLNLLKYRRQISHGNLTP